MAKNYGQIFPPGHAQNLTKFFFSNNSRNDYVMMMFMFMFVVHVHVLDHVHIRLNLFISPLS